MISGAGAIVRGRDAIEAYYRQQIASASARSGRHHTHPPEAIRIRFVTPDVALIDLPSRSVGGQDAAGQPLSPSELRKLVALAYYLTARSSTLTMGRPEAFR